ncbi:hypothetical protein KIPB_017037, partial [Kipferlia bialata]
ECTRESALLCSRLDALSDQLAAVAQARRTISASSAGISRELQEVTQGYKHDLLVQSTLSLYLCDIEAKYIRDRQVSHDILLGPMLFP